MIGRPGWRSEFADSTRRGLPIHNMAYKFREEIVGKRFLSVSGFTKLKVNKISEWGWRAGVIRAASHRDNGCHDLQVSTANFHILLASKIQTRVSVRRTITASMHAVYLALRARHAARARSVSVYITDQPFEYSTFCHVL